jgi:diphosphomevalonate decarboxylase
MSVTARSVPNIALIKYWGNKNNELRLCAAGSTSMTLNTPSVDVTIYHAETLTVTSRNKEMKEKDIARFEKTLQLIKNYLSSLGYDDALPASLSIAIESGIPPSIGLASSSAVFSALAKAISELIDADLTDEQISVMARLGSGSAARSIFGGFGAIRTTDSESIDSAVGWQIADEHHWPLHDIIIVPSTDEKKIGSTEGHAKAQTSPHFADRMKAIEEYRLQDCIDAIQQKDFEKLQAVAEEDCMDMHECMQTQNPALHYLSEETFRIIGEIKELRESEHLPVLYTMDAGPTVHLFCTNEARERVAAFAHAQASCTIFEAAVGPGSHIV